MIELLVARRLPRDAINQVAGLAELLCNTQKFEEIQMIRRIDHISIAVKDLEKAKAFFLDTLGGKELYSAEEAGQNFRFTTLEVGTSCLIELIDPMGMEGFVQRFLDRRGEGAHHVTIQVDDIKAIHEHLVAKGIETFGYSEEDPTWKEFFIHPKKAFGVLIQFAEFDPLKWINPGYIPPAYKEFAPPREVGDAEEKVEIRRCETDDGSQIEIRQGETVIRFSEDKLGDLVDALSNFLPGR